MEKEGEEDKCQGRSMGANLGFCWLFFPEGPETAQVNVR